MSDKIFTNGLWFKEWAEPMPKFIKGKISIKVPDFIPFLQQHQNNGGYVNISIKESQKGIIYCELDTFVLKPKVTDEEEANYSKLDNIDLSDGRDLTPDPDSPF